MFEKNRLKKGRKIFFNKHMNIVAKNGGKKSEKEILLETHEYRELKTIEKIDWKKCEITFFINTRIS